MTDVIITHIHPAYANTAVLRLFIRQSPMVAYSSLDRLSLSHVIEMENITGKGSKLSGNFPRVVWLPMSDISLLAPHLQSITTSPAMSP